LPKVKFTKVIKLEIVKPVGEDWKPVGDRLRRLQEDTSKALNYCMRWYYVEGAKRCEELEKAGEKINKKNVGIIGKSLFDLVWIFEYIQ